MTAPIPTRKARKRNPRVIAHDILREMESNVHSVRGQFQGPYREVVRDGVNAHLVIAPPERQTENDPEAWRRLARYMDAVERAAQVLRDFANDRIAELEDQS